MDAVLRLLREQTTVTVEGVDAFVAWAGGDVLAAGAVADAKHRADVVRRELLTELATASVASLEPQDLFALSHAIDRILERVRDLVVEAEVIACPPDAALDGQARLLGEAVDRLADAIAPLGTGSDATQGADAAIATVRRLEQAYRRDMAALLEDEAPGDRVARRELYRRCAAIGEVVLEVAERAVYVVLKQR